MIKKSILLAVTLVCTSALAQDNTQPKNGFGNKDVHFTTDPAYDFSCDIGFSTPLTDNTADHVTMSFPPGQYDQRTCQFSNISNWPEGGYMKKINLPNGVLLEGVRVWGYLDFTAQPTPPQWDLRKYCQPGFGPGKATNTPIASGVADSVDGYFSKYTPIAGGETIDNRDCYYFMRVQEVHTFYNYFQKARFQWRRQTSPAPAVPSFLDVPASHPFYQSIEAMASSGITGGCGGGNYCPDDGLTRGQMAAFLARALGIHFGSSQSDP